LNGSSIKESVGKLTFIYGAITGKGGVTISLLGPSGGNLILKFNWGGTDSVSFYFTSAGFFFSKDMLNFVVGSFEFLLNESVLKLIPDC